MLNDETEIVPHPRGDEFLHYITQRRHAEEKQDDPRTGEK